MRVGGHIDAFLSFNSKDIGEVRPIRDALRGLGCEVYLYEEEGIPGDLVTEKLADAIARSGCFFVFHGTSGYGRWQKLEIPIAINLFAAEQQRIVPIILSQGSEPENRFLKILDWVDLRPGAGGGEGAEAPGSREPARVVQRLLKAINAERARHRLPAIVFEDGFASVSGVRPGVAGNRPVYRLSPALLPRLCDRDDHCKLVNRIAEDAKGPPHIFLVPSEPNQALGSFFSRLREHELPRHLNLEQETCVIEQIAMNLSRVFRDPRDYEETLRLALIERLYSNGRLTASEHSSPQELAAEIAALSSVVMIRTSLTASSWQEAGPQKARSLISFWQQFPSIPGDRVLLVFLFLELPPLRFAEVRASMLGFLDALGTGTNGEDRRRLHLLPPIDGAIEDDFIFWAVRAEVADCLGKRCDDLEDEVREIYAELCAQALDRVPLREAEKRLATLLEELIDP